MKKISIIDYGMGNVESLKNAILKIGHEPELYSNKSKISSNISIIPGVGAFNHAMTLMKKKEIDKEIIKFCSKKNNFLIGICLGMQLLFDKSTENDSTIGLKLISGDVNILTSDKKKKLPNVGWKKTEISNNDKFNFINKYNNESFYYIHSYKCEAKNNSDIIGYSKFKDENFCSIVTNGSNIIGTQFHPEKSGEVGLSFLNDIIKNIN